MLLDIKKIGNVYLNIYTIRNYRVTCSCLLQLKVSCGQSQTHQARSLGDFLRDDMDMCFLQKTGFKLVKFGLCGSIYILHPAIGGPHPVPCLSTQITERQGTAMY